MKKSKGIKLIEKYQDNLEELKVKCKCGHSLTMPAFVNKGICSYCGSTVYNNTKLHFKYKLRKEMEKLKK